MKVIFLDLDGVMNVIPQGRDRFGAVFHSHFIDNLKRIIDETGAKIVISSTWRHSGLSVMKDMWETRGLPGEVIDITTDCAQIIYDENDEFLSYESVERGYEIKEWLDKNPDVESYVILDDNDDMLKEQLRNFVQTSDNISHPDCIDIGYGLTSICTDKAIEILKNLTNNNL